MSWEWSDPKEYPCPCGKGTYSESHGTDDWNRSDDRQTMNCQDCAAKYEWGNLTPGKPEFRAHYGWVPKKKPG
jgi:hypothetical protein